MQEYAIYDNITRELHIQVPAPTKKINITMPRTKNMQLKDEKVVFQRMKEYIVRNNEDIPMPEVTIAQMQAPPQAPPPVDYEVQRQSLIRRVAEMRQLCVSLQQREDEWRRREDEWRRQRQQMMELQQLQRRERERHHQVIQQAMLPPPMPLLPTMNVEQPPAYDAVVESTNDQTSINDNNHEIATEDDVINQRRSSNSNNNDSQQHASNDTLNDVDPIVEDTGNQLPTTTTTSDPLEYGGR